MVIPVILSEVRRSEASATMQMILAKSKDLSYDQRSFDSVLPPFGRKNSAQDDMFN